MTNKSSQFKIIGLLLIMMLLLVACGGGEAGPTELPEPTKTLLPTYEYIEPTNPPVFEQNAESTEEASTDSEDVVELDAKLVGRGLGRYEALECGICHGVDGVGTDEIGGLLEFSLDEDSFVTFMRSGGEIGNSHQYSTDRLSKNGAANLYQYLLSLTQGD